MKEQISALMDGELDENETGHLFVSLRAKTECAECWQTYHLIGDVMRGTKALNPRFKQSVMQKLESEPIVFAPGSIVPQTKTTATSSVLWPIAASVAAVAFVGWVVMQQQVENDPDTVPLEVAQNIPAEYLMAHQAVTPNSAAYYIQPAGYPESGR